MTSADACTRPAAHVALLGLGTVGTAVAQRLAAWQAAPIGQQLHLRVAATSQLQYSPAEAGELSAQARVSQAACDALQTLGLRHCEAASSSDGTQLAQRIGAALGDGSDGAPRIVMDATASSLVTDAHRQWLAQGIHVVTACKLGQGTALADWQAIRDACAEGNTQYGDAATVGAGLPLIRSIRELQAGGDEIHAIAGVLSGSLAWLFNHYDGMRPFSGFVREARDAGFTEPDPRDDLSGEDVRRKITILARAAGVPLASEDVQVQSLVPESLAALPASEVDAALPQLDASLRERFASAYRNGEVLRFIARFENGKASVGLQSLAPEHPLAGGAGTDNRVAIWSSRYCDQPLVIQGPGAGAMVTAGGLLDDALRIARQAASH